MGTTCQLPKDEDEVCGKLIDPKAHHPSLCGGRIRLRAHNALKVILATDMVTEGAAVDIERRIPELYGFGADGRGIEAIMDLCVSWPAAGRRHLIDITVRCPFAERYADADSVPGRASDEGAKDKLRRYGPSVSAFPMESLGRLGTEGHATLRALAQDSVAYGRWRLGRSPGFNIRELRLKLEASLLRLEADALLLALGCRATSALGWTASTVNRRQRLAPLALSPLPLPLRGL